MVRMHSHFTVAWFVDMYTLVFVAEHASQNKKKKPIFGHWIFAEFDGSLSLISQVKKYNLISWLLMSEFWRQDSCMSGVNTQQRNFFCKSWWERMQAMDLQQGMTLSCTHFAILAFDCKVLRNVKREVAHAWSSFHASKLASFCWCEAT